MRLRFSVRAQFLCYSQSYLVLVLWLRNYFFQGCVTYPYIVYDFFLVKETNKNKNILIRNLTRNKAAFLSVRSFVLACMVRYKQGAEPLPRVFLPCFMLFRIGISKGVRSRTLENSARFAALTAPIHPNPFIITSNKRCAGILLSFWPMHGCFEVNIFLPIIGFR